jgi:hypothetical protein
VWVGLGVVLHRCRRPPIGIALPQHGVHGTAHDLVVTGTNAPLVVRLGIIWVVRQGVAVSLQFDNGRLELRAGCRDVRKLDDVGPRGLGQLTQFGQGIVNALALFEVLGKTGDDAPGEGDVTGLHRHPSGGGIRLNHRQEGVRRQGRSLIGMRVNDGRFSHRCSTSR